ncbi:MAG: peptidylprolyl isomerase [Planctomycetia bacterium]|nr:peptidylprolyl isomerase [Planctomycetia bacterium]
MIQNVGKKAGFLLLAGWFFSGMILWGQTTRPSVESARVGKTAPSGRSAIAAGAEDDCCDPVPDLTQTFGKKTQSQLSPQQALAEFVRAYRKLDSIIDEHDELSEKIVDADEKEQKEMAPRLRKLSKEVHDLYHQTQDLIELAWQANPQNPEVISYTLFLLASALDEDQYEVAIGLSRELMGKKIHEKEPMLYEMAGIAAFMVNKFDVARLCFNEALRNNQLTQSGGAYQESIPYYTEAWKAESALRQKEVQEKTLPRVLLQTSKGNVLVELFEDQAPNTVANFISLVEKGFYNNNDFHTVISGFMAQTGSPTPDGAGNPGYSIPDEFKRPDARKHFRGSLSMAHSAAPNSAGSQFFITLVPTPHLDGKYTVFGRVISGIEVISALERMNVHEGEYETDTGLNEADKIIKAQVVRKRNHPYEPQTLPLAK